MPRRTARRTLSTERGLQGARRARPIDASFMLLAHAYRIVEAQSCLAELADSTDSFEESHAYDHALLELDGILGDEGPGCWHLDTADRAVLRARAERAIEGLIEFGADALSIELLLVSLDDIGT